MPSDQSLSIERSRHPRYIVRSIDGRSSRVEPRFGPRPPVVVTDADRRIARAVLRAKGSSDAR